MIQIEPFNRPDFERLISWIQNKEELVQFAGSFFSYPLTVEQLDRYIKDDNRHAFKVMEPPARNTIGHGEIYINENGAGFLCRILIGDPTRRGQGLGQQLVSMLLETAFIQLKLTKIELNVYDWNTGAVKCYKKAGFVINPDINRTTSVNGKTWKSLNMVLEKSKWNGFVNG